MSCVIRNDYGRFSAIRILSNMGFINQIVVGHDVCFKVQLKEFGGFGYSHLLENVVLVMKTTDFEDEINTCLLKSRGFSGWRKTNTTVKTLLFSVRKGAKSMDTITIKNIKPTIMLKRPNTNSSNW